MRKSFNGLSAMVKRQLNENPLSGALFVFVNRRKTLMKVLWFDRSGYSIWFKRLEAGVFQLPVSAHAKAPLSYTQLKCILEGIDVEKLHQRKRYVHAMPDNIPYNTAHECTDNARRGCHPR
jgi:transposase